MFDISIFFIYRILHFSKSKGISLESLLKSAGVDLMNLNRFDSKISERYYYAILNEAIRLTGDPHLGLHMGEVAELRDLSNLGFIMANSKDLGEAIEKAIDYIEFIGAPLDLSLVRGAAQGELLFKPKKPAHKNMNHCIDEAVSSFYAIVKSITRKRFRLKEAKFSYPEPDNPGEYHRIFRCPVWFNQSVTALVLHSRDLFAPVIHSNSKLMVLSETKTKGNLQAIIQEKDYSRKITILLFGQLQKGPPCIKEVAKELGMSVRCLQMKLSGEGMTFSQVVRDVRRELAKTYLGNRDYSIDEITFLLGFSEPSVFHRAFKTWTGQTPGEFRSTA